MAKDVIIRAEGLGKRYTIGHEAQTQGYVALRDVMARAARGWARSAADLFRGRSLVQGDSTEDFWALRDVNFEIQRGAAVGIIGRNGAGKSTLLKVLSRITEPTTGRVSISGRVASLLEVGTGFHPELTGRENIYLNGAVLGMTRQEIKRKFDEIVEFAEIHRFLDTPVKRYSSGMYVRLAFAVAAHLEPEILIVDEVLAVGDAEFQKKCLGKMSEVAGGGRTVLFVSHNMAAIEALCPTSIHMASGSVVSTGPTSTILADYLQKRRDGDAGQGGKQIVLDDSLTLESLALSEPVVAAGGRAEISITFKASQPGQIYECAILVYSALGNRVAIIDLREHDLLPYRYSEGRFRFTIKTGPLPLVEGEYALGLWLGTTSHMGDHFDLAQLDVVTDQTPRSFAPYAPNARGHVVLTSTGIVAELDG